MTEEMMKGRGAKFRILELLSGEDMWNYEVVERISSERNQTSRFMKDSFNFDLIEVMAAGFIEPVQSEVDTDGSKLGEGRLLTKYRITDLGKNEFAWMCS